MRARAALAAVLALPAAAAAGPLDCALPGVDERCERWVSVVDHPGTRGYGDEVIADSLLSADGTRLYVTGTTEESDDGFPNTDVLTLAIDTATGTVAWKVTYDGVEANMDHPAGLALSPDGSRLFVGATVNDTYGDNGVWNADFGVIAYDAATGAQRWVQTYDGRELQGRDYGNNQVRGIAVTPDGSTVIITGPSLAGATRWDIATFAYDAATGGERWRARYDRGQGDDRSSFLAVDEGHAYVVGYGNLGTGTVGETDGNDDLLALAYRTDPGHEGEIAWAARRDTGASDAPTHVAATPGVGRLIVLRYLAAGGGKLAGYEVSSLDPATGTFGWTAAKQATTAAFFPHALVAGRDSLFVAGTRSTPGPSTTFGLVPRNMDFATTAFDLSTGAEAWTSTYAFSDAATEEEALTLTLNPAGTRVYVSGYSSEAFFTYVPASATVALNAADGARRWVARYRRPTATLDHDRPATAHVSPSGDRLFVGATLTYRPDTEHSRIASTDLAVLAYDACDQVCPI